MASQDNQSVVRSTGKVSWFSDSKGYGFIKPDEEGEELFVHQSSIVSDGFRTLTVNESVEFEIAEGDDGKTKAVEVTAPGGGPLKNKKESGGGNGRNSRRGGNRCFNCGEFGHMAKECEGEAKKEGCYQCGESGHFARDCVKGLTERVAEVRVSGGGGGKECYKCGEVGHIARECGGRREGGGGGGGGCYTCGGVGHMARECPTKTGECYECGGTGHFARDCVKRGGGGSKKKGCFTCGNVGHFAKECQQVA